MWKARQIWVSPSIALRSTYNGIDLVPCDTSKWTGLGGMKGWIKGKVCDGGMRAQLNLSILILSGVFFGMRERGGVGGDVDAQS